MADDADLLAERAHLELARSCLDIMRSGADHIADYGVDELASYGLGQLRAQRLAALNADPDAPAFFGRTDRDTEVFHIGRRHIRDPSGDPVVIDWRAPIARAFYRATPADRMGVRLRRRFGFSTSTESAPGVGAALTSFEDEHLDRGEALGLDSGLLRSEIERPRVGPMRDIVATIQPDQDDLVRADLDTSLCVQGAPGTGKTAVGLHRAAYLLYTFPDRLRRSGVLVVGPNAAFLDYIAQVLPSLGELGITQSTVDGLTGHQATGGTSAEPVTAAVLKGDARMAQVLRRAVLSQVAKPVDDLVILVGTRRFRIGTNRLRRYVDDARRALDGGLRWSAARERLGTQLAHDVRRQREDAGGAPSDAETARVARSAAVKAWLDEVWPALSPATVLTKLYEDDEFLQRVSRDVLDDDERERLKRPAEFTRGRRKPAWTVSDAVLLDELRGLLDGTETYLHVVLDEAQDLSAMQCRVVARRCPLGSITVLGDLAQATTSLAPGDWAVTLAHLGHADTTIRPLTAGYRVPGEVLDLANRLLPYIAAGLAPATSIRHGDEALLVERGGAVVGAAIRALGHEGSIGVIVADEQVSATNAQLEALPAASDLARITVVAASQVKGLEFDSVILVEPADIVDGPETSRLDGLRRLYVALTRAVSRLHIVHARELPPELG